MNEQKKNLLGHIYGSRKSFNGKWLNLIIAVDLNGEKTFITCPVRMEEDEDGNGKPYAKIEYAVSSDGARYGDKAVICDLPIYAEKKKAEPQTLDDDLPF